MIPPISNEYQHTESNNTHHLDPEPTSLGKIGLIGCGNWGKNLTRNFHQLDFLHTVCDLNLTALQSVSKLYKGVLTTERFEDLLETPEISGIVIATPSLTHHRLAKAALLAGKHVYVEKPIATNSADAQELYMLAQQHERVLMVGHLLLYHPAVKRLKQLIEEGYLGEIRYIQSDRLNFNAYRQDKSVLWDLAPHDLSMMCYLLGMHPEGIISASGHRTSTDGLVDVTHVELQFPNQIGGHIHNSWIHPTKHVKLIVRGSERTAIIDDTLTNGKLQIFKKESDPQPLKEFPEYLTIEPLKMECQHFLNCIQHHLTPKTDGLNGYEVVKILELADQMIHQQLSN